jgi:hypothetical protein
MSRKGLPKPGAIFAEAQKPFSQKAKNFFPTKLGPENLCRTE